MIKVNGKEVVFEKFPNGETKLVHDSIEKGIPLMFPKIHFKFEDDSDLIKLRFVKNYLDSFFGIDAVKLTIYYMPYSRMDRSEEGSPFTLKYVSNFINEMNFSKVVVIEPHSDVTPALLNNVESKFINFDLLPKVMEEVGFDIEKDYIMFPDLGASRRYKNMKTDNVLIGHKVRDFKTGEIQGLDLIGNKDKQGKTAIIVDDLSSYGGTFVHSAKRLRAEGFEKIYLLVAHAENSIFKGELFDHVDKVFTTDTILTEQGNWENAKFKEQLQIYNIEEVLNG